MWYITYLPSCFVSRLFSTIHKKEVKTHYIATDFTNIELFRLITHNRNISLKLQLEIPLSDSI